MKYFYLIILNIVSQLVSAQNINWKTYIQDTSLVTAYVRNDIPEITLFSSCNKKGKHKTLINTQSDCYCWYVLKIKQTKNNWAQVSTVLLGPGHSDSVYSDLENYWIPLNLLKVDIPSKSTNIYDKPNGKPLKHFVWFASADILETRGNWAKVKILVKKNASLAIAEDILIIGWINRHSQDPWPWTTVNW
jgi:hypothetical protein